MKIASTSTAARLLPLLLLFMPGLAFALDMDYYTYNAFEETVMGFQRLALISSDSIFVMMAGCFVVISVLFGGMIFAAQGHMGQANNPLALMVPFLIGLAVFFGAVVPKGNVYIYDPVRNKNQAVGGVPDIIVFMAGTLSKVELAFTRVVDTASATPYADDAGAINYSLLLNATRAPGITTNLEDTIGQYFMDCGFTAIGASQNGTTKNEVLRATNDLYDTFAKYSHPSWPTVYYPEGNDGGLAGTCADSWTYIDAKLGAGNVASTLSAFTGIICQEAGFNPTDAAQLSRCQTQITTAAGLYGVVTASSPAFLRSYAFAAGITKMQSNPNFSVAQGQLVNRQLMAEGFGTAEAMNQWVPKLRGFLVATVLGITPIALIFVATPLVFRALALIIGLFAWLALWGIADAISVAMARDAATAAFSQIQQYHMGYEAIMNTPDAAVQALGVFGKARMMALMVATVLSGGLLKFGGYAFTSMAQGWQSDLGHAGQSAGQQTMQPNQNASLQQGMIDAPGQMARATQTSFDTAAAASSQDASRRGYGAQTFIDHNKFSGFNELNRAAGSVDAGHTVGSVQGTRAVADRSGSDLFDTSKDVQGIQTERTGVSAQETRAAGKQVFGGDGVASLAAFQAKEGVAGAGAQRDLSKRFGGDGADLAQLRPLEQQKVNETGAAIDASGADPERDLGARTVGARERLASAETLDSFGQGPERAGTADSQRRFAGVEAQEGVVDRHGYRAGLVAPQVLQQERAATAGVTAEHLGGAAAAGHMLGRQDLARDLGQARMQDQLAKFFYGGSDADLAKWHQAGAGNFSTVVEGPQAQKMADHLQASGAITNKQADMLKRKGSYGVTASMGESGKIAAARFDGSFSSFQGSVANVNDGVIRHNSDIDSTSFERSNTQVRRDSSTDDYTKDIRGAAAFTQDRKAVADQIEHAFKGNMVNGAPDANSKNQIVGQFVESLAASGYRLGAQDSEQFQAGARVSGSVGTGQSAPLSAGGGVDASRAMTQTSTVNRDAANSYYREAFDRSINEGRKEAAARPNLSAEERNRYIADYAAIKLTDSHRDAIERASDQTTAAYQQNDVIEDTASDRRRQDANTRGKEDQRSLFEKFEDTSVGQTAENFFGKN